MTEKEMETIKIMSIVFGSVFAGLMVLFYALTVVLHDPNEANIQADLPRGYDAVPVEQALDITESSQYRQNPSTNNNTNWQDEVVPAVSAMEPFVPSSTVDYVPVDPTSTEKTLLEIILERQANPEPEPVVIERPAVLDYANKRNR